MIVSLTDTLCGLRETDTSEEDRQKVGQHLHRLPLTSEWKVGQYEDDDECAVLDISAVHWEE